MLSLLSKPKGLVAVAAVAALLGCRQPTHVEEGVASFYAESLQGRTTANGETYDPSDFTAAHRNLPFGTEVKVTNLDNGRTVWVRVNDRGPYAEGRIIDLSGAAAHELGLTEDGTAQVRLEIFD